MTALRVFVIASASALATGLVSPRRLGIWAAHANVTEDVVNDYGERYPPSQEFAFLSAAAECTTEKIESWTCGPCKRVDKPEKVKVFTAPVQHGLRSYIAQSDDSCVVAFTANASMEAWKAELQHMELAEAKAPHNFQCEDADGNICKVGKGFLSSFASVAPSLRAGLKQWGCGVDRPVVTTGLGLGGALAAIALYDFYRQGLTVGKSWSFGAARPGDDIFLAAFRVTVEATLGEDAMSRITKVDDPVPLFPARDDYWHVGQEIYFTGEDGKHKTCSGLQDPTCSQANLDKLDALTKQCVRDWRSCGHRNYFSTISPTAPFKTAC